jgi:hypothetical protein
MPALRPGDPWVRPDARAWWKCLEPVHAVTYFAPECRERSRAIGLRGFWMGYFAARAAPLGAVGPATVEATFSSFHGSMVRRAIPDAWSFADPRSILEARQVGAAAALRRLLPSVDQHAAPLVPSLHRVIDDAIGAGRTLFSANRGLDRSDDPVERLWQACTCLREHRGDGHVAALTTHALDGCEALVLFAVSEGIPGTLFRQSRGWSSEEWESARRRLENRGLVDGERISPAGRGLRLSIEQLTDELAAPPFAVLGTAQQTSLWEGLRAIADAVVAAAVIPFPNPMGLPAPWTG